MIIRITASPSGPPPLPGPGEVFEGFYQTMHSLVSLIRTKYAEVKEPNHELLRGLGGGFCLLK